MCCESVSMVRLVLAALVWILAAGPGRAQDNYPSRTVKLVVPAFAGSTTDTVARVLAEPLSEKWGKPVIVENISRGGSSLGMWSSAAT